MPPDSLSPSYFWCTLHNLPHRDDGLMFADGQVHMLNGCTMVGPYFTWEEAVEWGAS
jgi:hypothetical protein